MNTNEIKSVMKIVRAAIVALYGRQPLRLIRYNDTLAYQGHPLKSMFLTVQGERGGQLYEVRYERNRVTSLEVKEPAEAQPVLSEAEGPEGGEG